MSTTELVVERRPKEKKISGPYGIWTHDLCDTGAALYQLSQQAKWELFNMLDSIKPFKWWIMPVNIWKSCMCAVVEYMNISDPRSYEHYWTSSL